MFPATIKHRQGQRRPHVLRWRARARLALPILLTLPLTLTACTPESERPSILLVTLDTTRADRLGCYGFPDAATTTLDALASRGTLFESAYTSAPITLPAHASIFTGTYPQFHGVRDNGSFRLDDRLETLAEVLAADGYRTGAFVGAYPVDSRFGLDQGFEVYDDRLAELAPGQRFSYPERPASDVIAATSAWLDTLTVQEAFFGWVHVFDPHAPYDAPEPFGSAHRADPYQGEIAYVDHELGRLLEHLESLSRLDNTLVIVVSDHGEGLGEHGEDSHAALIYDSTMRVPLILAGPGIASGSRVANTVRTIDILPTITELLNLPTPADNQGASLLALIQGDERAGAPRSAYIETEWPRLQYGWSPLRGLVLDGWKLIDAPDAPDDNLELYHLQNDPHEQTDLVGDATARNRLSRELTAVLEDTTAAEAFDASRTLSAEDAERLEALGYIGTPTPSHFGAHPRLRLPVMRGIVAVRNLIREGRARDALALLDQLEQQDPGGLGLHEHRGLAYRELGAADPAALGLASQSFRKALEINPRRAEIWVHLGEVQRQMGDFPGALESYTRSIALTAPSPELQVNLAGVLLRVGRGDEAISRIEALLAERPDYAQGWLTLGVMRAGAGEQEGALASFHRAIETTQAEDPLRLQAHDFAGVLLEQMDRPQDAIAQYEAALQLAPDHRELAARLERLRRR